MDGIPPQQPPQPLQLPEELQLDIRVIEEQAGRVRTLMQLAVLDPEIFLPDRNVQPSMPPFEEVNPTDQSRRTEIIRRHPALMREL